LRTIAAPADKRFRRAHVKPARRRTWHAAVRPALKYTVLALLTVYVVYRGTAVLANAPLLAIDRITVRGNQWLATAEVEAVLRQLRGENIVWADLDVWRRRLMASPWVKDAALRRSLPSTIEVVVFERVPVCIGRINGSLHLIDERGVIIDEYGPHYSEFDLPIVDGLGSAKSGAGGGADTARAELAAKLIASLAEDPAVAERLSQVDVSDVNNVSVILTGDPAVIYVGRELFLPRLQSYVQLAAALREREPDIDYVDLRLDNRIIVRPSRRPR
jgi:cell division protein FtsQ